MSWNTDPVVVTVAITGADVFRENNPNIPYTTEEIADSTIEARRPARPSPTCTCARTTAPRAGARSCSWTRSTGSAPAATC